jgi:hypothetical protein
MHITCKAKGVQEVIANLKKYDEKTQQKIGDVVHDNDCRKAKQAICVRA